MHGNPIGADSIANYGCEVWLLVSSFADGGGVNRSVALAVQRQRSINPEARPARDTAGVCAALWTPAS
jgi:hypothetical protein